MTTAPASRPVHAFLEGGGETGALIRAFDWSATPLGEPGSWPPALKTAVSLLLTSAGPVYVAWGPDLLSLYNDGYLPIVGAKHPGIGLPFSELWAEIWDEFRPIVGKTMTGDAQHFVDMPIPLAGRPRRPLGYFTFSYTPLRDDDGTIAGFYCAATETTEKVLAEEMGSFLLHLLDETRQIRDADAIVALSVRAIGQRLRAMRVAYVEVDDALDRATVRAEWTDGTAPALPPDLARKAFARLLPTLRAGRTVALDDARADGGLQNGGNALLDLASRAIVDVPLLKDGRLVACLSVHHRGPRAWSDAEVQLIETVAERTWAAVERARVETSLRASEDHLAAVYAQAAVGLPEADLEGRFLEVNDAFCRIVGRSRDELLQGIRMQDITHPDDLAANVPLFRRCAETGEGFEIEKRYLRPDGSEVWVANSVRALPGPDGRPRTLIAATVDITSRRAAEARLRESEARFRLMADAVPQIVWITDADGRVEFFNKQWSDYTGHPFSDTTASRVAVEHLHPDDGAATIEAFDEARRSGRTFLIEHRIRSASGDYRWFLVRGEPQRDPDTGAIVRWFGASVDIHDRKIAEEALQHANETLEARVAERTAALAKSERRARAILDASYQIMVLCELDGRIVVANQAARHALGSPDDDMAGLLLWEAPFGSQTTSAAERLRREVANAAAGRQVRYETELAMPDGSVRTLDFLMRPVLDAEGQPVQLVAEWHDVTEMKAAQAAVLAAETARRESDALYRAYFEHAPEALFVIGVQPDGTFVVERVNPTHERAVGFRLEDVRGRPLESFLPPEIADQITRTYRHVLETERIHQYREAYAFDGETQHWDTSLVPVAGPDGRIARIMGSSRNVTAQVVAEDRLRQSQKMQALGQLTGGLAHDFNNLLGAVLSGFDLIRRKPDDPQRVLRIAENGMAAAERGARLTAQLLAFSRAQKIDQRPLAVATVVDGMRDLLAHTLGPQVRLAFRLDGASLPVLTDPVQLEMAVLNLAINASDAMPGGGELTITTTPRQIVDDPELQPGEYLELSVTDTGGGMPPEIVARAFDPFFTTKGVGKGTGLGLSQVYGIAKQAGGVARILSQPGKGTTVSLLLPRTDGEILEAPDAVAESQGAPGQAATVLIVDDDDDLRRMLAESLDTLGYRVLEAADGPGGLALLDQHRPDLVVLDFAMPGMNGAEVAEAIRARHSDLPIVFASGYADTSAIERVAGADAAVLHKPFRIDEMQAVLSEALRRNRRPTRAP